MSSSIPQPTLAQIVDRARILVVDDKEFPYLPLFKRDGYNVTKWRDVTKLTEIEQGRYDVVLLDLQGIGRKLSKDQGLGVLRHIKTTRPSQVVVAYSNADWPLESQPFFELADCVLPKNADYVDFKREVDDLLQEHFSSGFHLNRIYRYLADAGINSWSARRRVRRAVAKRDTASLSKWLERQGIDSDSAELIIGLAQVAIGVAQIWTN